MQRLASEVQWRCFCVSGTIYFISEPYLFMSKPIMTISEETEGIDWIDFDYDSGKLQATVTITCHFARWSAPPGSIIFIKNMGIVNGRWLVNDYTRSLFDTTATIILKKPLATLPEPVTGTTVESKTASATGQPGTVTASSKALAAVAYCRSKIGDPYQWGAEGPGACDCSGLMQAAYNSVGIYLPRVADDQYGFGRKISRAEQPLPGDLVFFGKSAALIHHVGIYIGDNKMINAPHTGALVRIDSGILQWPDFFGMTRPVEGHR